MAAASTTAFEDLFALKQFADQLRQKHASALSVFADENFNGFKLSEATPSKHRISISSTATCLGSLILAGMWDAPITPQGERGWWVGRESKYLKGLLTANWTSAGLDPNNAFSAAFVLEAASLLLDQTRRVTGAPADTVLAERATFEGVEFEEGKKGEIGLQRDATYGQILDQAAALIRTQLLGDAPGAREAYVSVLDYPPSAYLTQLAARALSRASRIDEAEKDRVADWAAREAPAQAALTLSKSRNADPLALLFLVICLSSFRTASRKTPRELELVRYSLNVFFSAQQSDGGWPISRPLFHYPRTGSAYCYDYEALAQLLLCENLYDLLFDFLPQIREATHALENARFTLKNGSFAWASNHRPQDPGPESWSTASVYLYLFALDRFIAEGIRRAVARELELPYTSIRQIQASGTFAAGFLDCPLSAQDNSSLKDAILERLVVPVKRAAPLVALGKKLPDDVAVSAILFGPPGTSKTEIVLKIAEYVGWPAITVDPSYFVRNGLESIEAQANKIFRMLSTSEEVVILFDEFDEMVRDRENAGELLSRFLTTAMLPKLAKINKHRRALFIVATNYIDSFDVAISRAGRFDFVIQMMPPKSDAKLNAPDEGQTRGWSETLHWVKEQLNEPTFEEDLADLTFLETKTFVQTVVRRRAAYASFDDLRPFWGSTVKKSTLRKLDDGPNSSPAAREKTQKSTDTEQDTWKARSLLQADFIRFDR